MAISRGLSKRIQLRLDNKQIWPNWVSESNYSALNIYFKFILATEK